MFSWVFGYFVVGLGVGDVVEFLGGICGNVVDGLGVGDVVELLGGVCGYFVIGLGVGDGVELLGEVCEFVVGLWFIVKVIWDFFLFKRVFMMYFNDLLLIKMIMFIENVIVMVIILSIIWIINFI